jgi:asparagine synthase (glutamine-hydrolysing)
MCGIAGLIRTEDTNRDDIAAVERMLAAQIHRGPDDSGMHSDAHVVLGHRRLSIIDLSSAGRQPMSNEDGTVWVTYNGEIYNFKELRGELSVFGHLFRSQCDTEVLIHGYEQWGIDTLLNKLRGMFAFALYDTRRGLIIARDRLGIKPLYYFDGPSFLVFASEVRALIASGRTPTERDRDAVAGFLLIGSVPSPRTIFKGVRCLLPGHYLLWRDGHSSHHKYWDVVYDAKQHDGHDALRAELDEAVQHQLVSDVPLGVFLSGGVDSAAVVALASRKLETPLVTLTVAFEEEEFSEAASAREISKHFRTEHHEVLVTADDFKREIPEVLATMDQPTNDGVNTHFVSKAARAAGLKVVLSGLGGDEVFWGYRHHRHLMSSAPWLVRCPSAARKALMRGAAALGRFRGRESWMRLGYLIDKVSGQSLYLSMRGFFAPQQVARLLGMTSKEIRTTVQDQFGHNTSADANGFNYHEVKRYLHDQLLRDTDVFSMAHSVEVRVPLLDHKIVEYAAGVPPTEKMAQGINKPLLVHGVDDPLLLRAGARKKQGFSFPMDRWMKQSAGELEDMAADTGCCLDRAVVRNMWSAFRADRLHWSRAWALTVLGAAQ